MEVRGKTIPFCSKSKKQRIEQERILEKKITSLEDEFQIKPTTCTMILTEFEKKLRIPIINAIMMRSNARWVEHGERSTRYFCSLEERKFISKTIGSLESNGKLIIDTKEIMSALHCPVNV